MDMEMLTAISGMLQGLGATATTGFIWFLVIQLLMQLVAYSVGFAAIYCVYKLVPIVVDVASGNGMKQLRDMLGVGQVGCLTRDEVRDTLQKVRELIKNQKEEE